MSERDGYQPGVPCWEGRPGSQAPGMTCTSMGASVVTLLMGKPKMVGGLPWASSCGGFSVCSSSQADGWRKTVMASSWPPSSVIWLTISLVILMRRLY
jgi:hypothetical protein